MDFSDAVARVSDHLRRHGKAKNSALLDLLGGDAALLALVREELIFEGLAEDVRGVGLQWMGDAPEAASESSSVTPSPEASVPEPLPPPDAPVPVFLSYSHADTADFTKRLAKRLRADGFPVWIDESGIRHGPNVDWEAKIEAGIQGATVLVAVLSPHAVRRPDGVCLDEIALARYTSTAILPVMRVQCQPPLGIYRLNWLDARMVEGEGAFEDFYQRLRDALANQDFTVAEGTYAELIGQLRPLDFGRVLANYTRRFTGRVWLRDAVTDWLGDPDASPVFLLKGDPGTGKSAALAWLSGQLPGIGAIHFCRADNAETLDPAVFARSVAAQLAHQLGTTDAVLDAYTSLSARDDPGALFEALVATPTHHAPPDPERGPVVVVVDGLDEAARRDGPTIPALLADYLRSAAPGLRFLLSTRDEPRVLIRFNAFKPFVLEADRPENRDDLRVYLDLCFSEPTLRRKTEAAGSMPNEVAGWIEQRAEGNFLYAAQAVAFVEQIKDGADAARLTLHSFPSGLAGLYDTFFARLFPNKADYDARVRPHLDLLVAARAPLTSAQVAAAARTTTFAVQEALRDLAAFFPNDDGRFRPYHTSIPDWLRDAGTLWRVDVGGGNARLAEAGLRAWWPDGPDAPSNPDADPYHVQHLPTHLRDAVFVVDSDEAKQRWNDAVRLLTDFPYLHARADARDAAGLGRDLADTARALPDRHAGRETLRVLGRAVWYDTGFLTRHPESLFQQFWNRGWWWDSPEAAKHCRITDDAPQGYRPPWERGGAVHRVVERWRTEGHPGVPWMLALHPPADLFAADQNVFQGHTESVRSVTWSPTGRLASASSDNTVRVWDVDTGEATVLEGHTGGVTSVAWSPTGRLASASWDKTVRV
ncbi:MAG: TIR domain-containing protein, partial [Rhodothermales bacterium]|nr:TIR domain-containing protein [Rhodothermales bacterium]